MKNSLICSALLLLAMVAHAQSGRQGTPPSSTSVNQQAGAAWYRGGNVGAHPTGPITGDNTFGTRWNSPIYTITDTISRMKLNGTLTTGQYSINAYNASHGVNTSGYLLLGSNSTVTPISNKNIYSDMGAFSLLHLNGPRPGELSYRPWMQTGVTFTDAGDLGYVGLRFGNGLGSGNVVSEMVVAWGNDSIDALGGPDDMVFRFMGAPPSSDHSTTPSTNVNTSRDYDGKQIARFSANGNVGIGPSYTQLVASQPTHRLDVEGNARLRNVPGSNAPEYIMLGNVQSSNPADIEFQRLALPGNSNMFLSGNGTWQAISSGGGAINGAHNGASVSGSGNSMVAFGQSYSQSGTNPAALQDSRYVPMNDNNIYFTNNPTNPLSNTGFNKVAIGTDNPNLVGKLNVYSQNSGEGTALSLTNVATTGASGTEIRVNGVTPTTGLNNWGERINVSGSLSSNQGTEYIISGGNEAIGVTIDATGGTNGLGLRATASGSSTGTVTGVLGSGQRRQHQLWSARPGPNDPK
ncbi:MAG: hypothetical protein U0176_00410 [Bacteroidia bacterium]